MAWVLRLAVHPEKVPARPQGDREQVLSNYLAYARAQAAETRVPVGDLVELWNNRSTDYDLRPVTDAVVKGHQAVADTFLQLGVLDGPAPVAPLWDHSFASALQSGPAAV